MFTPFISPMTTKNIPFPFIFYFTFLILITTPILFVWNTPIQAASDIFWPTAPQGITLTVTDNSDSSDINVGDGICDASFLAGEQCTLRAAIEELNAQGPDITPHVIEFNIAGTGPFTIAPASPLPDITVPLEIRGETQAGTTCPTNVNSAVLMIVLDGSNAGNDVDGLVLDYDSDGSLVRGLAIGNFDGDGIHISSDNNRIRCNHIGVGADGVSDIGNGSDGVQVSGVGNSIGGETSHAQRNVISGNGSNGIRVSTTLEGTITIVNNFIGTTANGMAGLPNLYGIYFNINNSTIGGTSDLSRNIISGNSNYGIRINTGDNNTVLGNLIGVARDGVTPLPNLSSGIEILGDAVGNRIGGLAAGEANIIQNNGGIGIVVDSNVTGNPIQNELRGNSLFNNGDLGVDLGSDGIDVNDSGDGDAGENEHQNYPVLELDPGGTVLTAVLDSQPNTQYTLDLYRSPNCDLLGHGEGQEHLLTETVSTNGSGLITLVGDLAGLVSSGDGITATATDPNGNTSEFSACVTVTLPATSTPTPTHTATPGPSPTPTSTPTAGPSPTPTATSTAGPSPTPTATYTPGPSPTGTSTPVASPTALCTPHPDFPPCTPTPPPVLEFAIYLPIVQQ